MKNASLKMSLLRFPEASLASEHFIFLSIFLSLTQPLTPPRLGLLLQTQTQHKSVCGDVLAHWLGIFLQNFLRFLSSVQNTILSHL